MKLSVNYGEGELRIPLCVLDSVARASKRDIRVLLSIVAHIDDCSDYEQIAESVSSDVGCNRSEFDMSAAYWRGAGIIDIFEDDGDDGDGRIEEKNPSRKVSKKTSSPALKKKASEKEPEKADKFVVSRSADLPAYTTNELIAILNKRAGLKELIDESQRIMGKIFNTSENNIVIGLVDYYGFEIEYVIMLITYCRKHGTRSLKSVERLAINMFEEDITDVYSLSAKLERMEISKELEGEVRDLFGIHDRSLTAKEKKIIDMWSGDFGYGIDIIKEAFERTVDSTGKPSIHYAKTITERWYAEGVRTKEDIEKSDINYEKSKNADRESKRKGSFDTDEFFEAALKRSAEVMKKKEAEDHGNE